MTELEKRVKRAKEAFDSLPDWVKKAAVFHGGDRHSTKGIEED